MASSTPRKSFHRSRSSHRSLSNPHKTAIVINVYDLLPPGKLSTTLWHLGSPLLHTGIVIASLNREYAFGALTTTTHRTNPSATGVYSTRPHLVPHDAFFRCSLLQGFSFLPPAELEATVRAVSAAFKGAEYNLLTNNCNHFSSALCARLTGKPPPRWVNRAAAIGVCLPCFVPREWCGPVGADDDAGEEVEEEERRGLLGREGQGRLKGKLGSEDEVTRCRRMGGGGGTEGKVGEMRDEEGRSLPASEVTPLLQRVH